MKEKIPEGPIQIPPFYRNPMLKRPTSEVTEFGPHLDGLVERLKPAMLKTDPFGIAIAANQAMIDMSLIYMNLQKWMGREVIMVNPTIQDQREQQNIREGCLSFPGLYVKVKRARRVLVRWQDTAGLPHEEWFVGLPATVVQHEIDHLNGITFMERLTPVNRLVAERRMKKLMDTK